MTEKLIIEGATPGPWLLATSNSWRRIVNTEGAVVCAPTVQKDGHPDLHFPNGGQDGLDARLLIAAPDAHLALFAACLQLRQVLHEAHGLELFPGARDAILNAVAAADRYLGRVFPGGRR